MLLALNLTSVVFLTRPRSSDNLCAGANDIPAVEADYGYARVFAEVSNGAHQWITIPSERVVDLTRISTEHYFCSDVAALYECL